MRYSYERINWSHDLKDSDALLREIRRDRKRLVAVVTPNDGPPYAILKIAEADS